MLHPRDHASQNPQGMLKAARLFSNVVSPPVMFAILGFVVAWHERPFWPGLGWAVAYGLIVSLAPILFVLYQLKKGRISDLHMSQPHERQLPYWVGAACAFGAFVLFSLVDAPLQMRCLTVFNGIELLTLGSINLYWLISMHTTGMTATIIILASLFGGVWLWILAPLLLLVGIIRLYLKRHTPAQLIAGVLLGILTVTIMQWLGCF